MKKNSLPAIPLHVTQLTDAQCLQLEGLCRQKNMEERQIPHARAAFKGDGITITLYESCKHDVQGKKTAEFLEFTLEPEILGTPQMGYEDVIHPEWFELHAGLDESGKGDLFGPLVSACVIADGKAVRQWIALGVRDSKNISSHQAIFRLEEKIHKTPHITCEVFKLSPTTYNRLYPQFHSNLNHLLAWMHAQCLENALTLRPETPWGLLDQFSKQPLVQQQLHQPHFELKMRPRAEEDPVVAAASILARAEFIRSMKKLSSSAGMSLKLGASREVKAQAQALILHHGRENFFSFAKIHFKTAQEALATVSLDEGKVERENAMVQ
jgi:ribonuclease HIII